MKCPNCSTENKSDAAYCIGCGRQLVPGMKTCANGHNYDASQASCPYCSSGRNSEETYIENRGGGQRGSSRETEYESGKGRRNDETELEGSKGRDGSPSTRTSVNPSSSKSDKSDHTMIMPGGNVVPGTEPSTPQDQRAGVRKLVGWLVTYDIQPVGMDYRLYLGRNIVGRDSKCDIVINQPGISAEHAIVLYREGKFIIADQMSMNGTYVNNVLIESQVYLYNDDSIRMGNINFKLKII